MEAIEEEQDKTATEGVFGAADTETGFEDLDNEQLMKATHDYMNGDRSVFETDEAFELGRFEKRRRLAEAADAKKLASIAREKADIEQSRIDLKRQQQAIANNERYQAGDKTFDQVVREEQQDALSRLDSAPPKDFK